MKARRWPVQSMRSKARSFRSWGIERIFPIRRGRHAANRSSRCLRWRRPVALYEAMRAQGVSKAELARRLGWPVTQTQRLLDLRHASRVDQLEAAFAVLGKRL